MLEMFFLFISFLEKVLRFVFKFYVSLGFELELTFSSF